MIHVHIDAHIDAHLFLFRCRFAKMHGSGHVGRSVFVLFSSTRMPTYAMCATKHKKHNHEWCQGGTRKARGE